LAIFSENATAKGLKGLFVTVGIFTAAWRYQWLDYIAIQFYFIDTINIIVI
jgi:hypothetical protein